ncbi:MAG: hypothetical protein F4Y29_04070 [Chloroflexi bacterium]|nr:hypothetical protein [Chloroflexota bacterium]
MGSRWDQFAKGSCWMLERRLSNRGLASLGRDHAATGHVAGLGAAADPPNFAGGAVLWNGEGDGSTQGFANRMSELRSNDLPTPRARST